jgi:hypothetical protein
LNAATNVKRLAKAAMLPSNLKVPSSKGQLIFFSDDKNFPQDQKINKKNNW